VWDHAAVLVVIETAQSSRLLAGDERLAFAEHSSRVTCVPKMRADGLDMLLSLKPLIAKPCGRSGFWTWTTTVTVDQLSERARAVLSTGGYRSRSTRRQRIAV